MHELGINWYIISHESSGTDTCSTSFIHDIMGLYRQKYGSNIFVFTDLKFTVINRISLSALMLINQPIE